jgi:hypothetical protein
MQAVSQAPWAPRWMRSIPVERTAEPVEQHRVALAPPGALRWQGVIGNSAVRLGTLAPNLGGGEARRLQKPHDMNRSAPLMRLPTAIQGPVYVASGLWPIVHLRSFEKVTGPKADGWLVKTVGGLLAVIGSSLIAGGTMRRPSRAMRVLGMGSAAVLALVDVVYASRGRISKIYFADAALQIAIGAAWLAVDRDAI